MEINTESWITRSSKMEFIKENAIPRVSTANYIGIVKNRSLHKDLKRRSFPNFTGKNVRIKSTRLYYEMWKLSLL
jgi:hypothetical protein